MSILYGPKTGFGVPYEYWLRTSLYQFTRERILDQGFLSHFAFDGGMVEKTMFEHHSGQRNKGFMLWKLLQLSLFYSLRRIDK